MSRSRKPRKRQPLGIKGDMERLLVHRELEALRHPNRRRFRKLEQAKKLARV